MSKDVATMAKQTKTDVLTEPRPTTEHPQYVRRHHSTGLIVSLTTEMEGRPGPTYIQFDQVE